MWAFDRRTEPARGPRRRSTSPRSSSSPQIALDWLFGGELGLTLHPAAGLGPEPPRRLLRHAGRRAVHRQLDARSSSRATSTPSSRPRARAAREPERLPRRPLGRHRLHRALRRDRLQPDRRRPAPTRATRSSAASCCSRAAAARPAARRSRPTRSTASRRKFDGGLFGAVRDNAPAASTARRRARSPTRRPTAPASCRRSARCRRPRTRVVPGLLNAAHPRRRRGRSAIQAIARSRRRRRTSCASTRARPATTPSTQVPDLARARRCCRARRRSAASGSFLDDDGLVAAHRVVRRDVGRRARVRRSAACSTWQRHHRGRCHAAPSLPEQRPAADRRCPAAVWGQEKEVDPLRSPGRRASTRAAPTSPTGTTRARASA